jgi:hypothetical protein
MYISSLIKFLIAISRFSKHELYLQHRNLLLRSLILNSIHRTVKVRFILCVVSELCSPELHMRSWSSLQSNFYNMLPVTEMLREKYWLLHAT